MKVPMGSKNKVSSQLRAFLPYLKNLEGNEQESINKMMQKDAKGQLLVNFFHKAVTSANLYREPRVKKVADLAYKTLQEKMEASALSLAASSLFQKDKEKYQTLLLIYREHSRPSCCKKESKTRVTRSKKKKSVSFDDTIKSVTVDRYLSLSPYAKVDREFKAIALAKKAAALKNLSLSKEAVSNKAP
jgi:hypothetical protein